MADPTTPTPTPSPAIAHVPAPLPQGIGRFRVFSQDADLLATEWSKYPEAPIPWSAEPGAVAQPGVEGGFWVCAPPRRGYAKPLATARADPHQHPVAALEKIAADLAFEGLFAVPPVTLFERHGAPAGEPRHHSVSAPPFKNVLRWGDVTAHPGVYAAVKPLASGPMSAMVAFDTWLHCGDHVGNPGNLLVTTTATLPISAYFAFIDYSYSMIHHWRAGRVGYTADFVAPIYDSTVVLDVGVVKEAIEVIGSMSDATIQEIVQRVPDPYITYADKGTLIDGLRYRRDNLRAIIGKMHPGVL